MLLAGVIVKLPGVPVWLAPTGVQLSRFPVAVGMTEDFIRVNDDEPVPPV